MNNGKKSTLIILQVDGSEKYDTVLQTGFRNFDTG